MNDNNILSSEQIITCACCLPSGDAWCSRVTRKQGHSAELRSCDLSRTSDDSVIISGSGGSQSSDPRSSGTKGEQVPSTQLALLQSVTGSVSVAQWGLRVKRQPGSWRKQW